MTINLTLNQEQVDTLTELMSAYNQSNPNAFDNIEDYFESIHINPLINEFVSQKRKNAAIRLDLAAEAANLNYEKRLELTQLIATFIQTNAS